MKFIELTLAEGINSIIYVSVADISYYLAAPKQGGGYVTKIFFNYCVGNSNEQHHIEVKETAQQVQKFIEQAR